jgi:hypothetical protein
MRILLLFFFLGTATARAEQVGVVVTGEAAMQPQLVNQLEGWLRKHGHQLVASPLPPDAINTLVDCFVIEDEGCARGVIEKRSKARAIVYARVDIAAGGDLEKTVTVLAYWFEKGKPAVAERRFCQRCTEATLRKTADDVIAALAKAGDKGSGGTLKLTSTPAGASCKIDGRTIGKTPLDEPITAGPHEITVVTEHHQSETRFVTVKPGETAVVDVALTADKPAGARSKMLPLVAMGAGGALLVTGVIRIAVDQDKGPDEPPTIHNTAPAGVGFALAGVAVAAGGYVWFRTISKREVAPVAAVSREGAYVGWVSRF